MYARYVAEIFLRPRNEDIKIMIITRLKLRDNVNHCTTLKVQQDSNTITMLDEGT